MAVGKKVKNGTKAELPPVLTVTLLSGFLGAGKTTLLKHILQTDHGLRIALVVNDIGSVNIDAALIRKTHQVTKTSQKIVELQNGCICCTLRGDLLEELVRLSKLAQFDYVIIESSGISEPEQVAETFDPQLADQFDNVSGENGVALEESTLKALEEIKNAGGLHKFARLDTTVTVVDAFTMLNDFDTDDLLKTRREDVTEEVDERTVSHLMVDQIEFADVIVLNKTDMVDAATRGSVIKVIKKLNHRAKLIEATFGKIDVKEIINTNMFNLEVARASPGWLKDLHDMTMREVNGRNVITPKPETEEYDVHNFVYVRHRPFHPRRLYELIYDKYILREENMEEDGEEDEDDEMEDADAPDGSDDSESGEEDNVPEPPSNEIILANRRAHPLLARLFRSKGEFYLATRPQRAGEWSQAGAMLTMTGGRSWFCLEAPETWDDVDPEVSKMVLHDIAKGGEWGDRRSEIVFIGEKLDHEALESLLDTCLLNEEEFHQWQNVMRDDDLDEEGKAGALENLFDDGFLEWSAEEEHDHDHDHDHGEEEE